MKENYQQKQQLSELKQLKSSEIQKVRTEILDEQGGKCAICGIEITSKTGISLDHQHRFKTEEIGLDGAGLIRGVCCRNCNLIEGKIWNTLNRFYQPENVNDRVRFLEKLISYYRKDNYDLIHPSERPKEPNVSKRNYNKLKKKFVEHKQTKESKKTKKFPDYPKSGKLTKQLAALFEQFHIPPYN